jgi:thymidylate synthase (FAD)
MFLSVCEQSELTYRFLTNKGMKAQEAREVLPLCTKTELIMTGTVEQWKGFFKLRCDKAAHPQARELAVPLKEEFIKRNLINS